MIGGLFGKLTLLRPQIFLSQKRTVQQQDHQRVAGDRHRVDFGLDTECRLGLTSREAIYQACLRGGPTGMRAPFPRRRSATLRWHDGCQPFVPRLAAIVEPLLSVRRVMRQQFAVPHKMLMDTVRGDPVCRQLMTAPGVGAVVALTYRATVDQPQRFLHSRAVGAHVGLTPKRYQSGETDYEGGVSKCGDALLRTMLYEAAHVLLTRGAKWSWLKAWGVRVAQRRGMRRAIVAVARRLAQ